MDAMQHFPSSSKSLLSDAGIMFDNEEYQHDDDISPVALMNDSDSEEGGNNIREQREHFRRRGEGSKEMGDVAASGLVGKEEKKGDNNNTPALNALLSHPTVMMTDTSETTVSDNEALPLKALGHSSQDDQERCTHDQASSGSFAATTNRIVVLLDEGPGNLGGTWKHEGDEVGSLDHSVVNDTSVVHVGDIESELESLADQEDEIAEHAAAQDFVDSVLAQEVKPLVTKEAQNRADPDRNQVTPIVSDDEVNEQAPLDETNALEEEEEGATSEGTTLTEKASADSLSSQGDREEDDPTECQDVMIIVSSDEVDVDEPAEDAAEIVESASGEWKLQALSTVQSVDMETLEGGEIAPEMSTSFLAPDLACSEEVDGALDSFVAELEKGDPTGVEASTPDRRMIAAQYLSSSTPRSVRDFWKTHPSSPTKKENDPALEQAVATTPVRARREAFLTASATPKAQEKNLANDPAFATPVSARREALLASATPKAQEKDIANDPAFATPVSARREALLANSTPKSQEKDIANDPAFATPVSARRDALLSVIYSPKEQPAGPDDALLAASKTPVHARQASLVTNSTHPIQRNSSEDEAIKAAAVTPVDVRRATLTAEIGELSRKPEAASDETLLAATTNFPVDARRAALTAEICELSRKPSNDEYDEARLAATINPVLDRRALLVKETSTVFRKPTANDAALKAASRRPVGSRRAALAEEQGARKRRSKRDVGLWASTSSIKTRRAALARDMHQSSQLSLRLQAELDALKEQNLVSSRKRRRNRRARNDRLFFHLNQRRGGMNDKDFLRLDDFLPHQRMLLELKASSEPYEGPQDSFDVLDAEEDVPVVPLRVWLTCPEEKVFEIVTVEMRGNMTVEDVVEEACSLALDPILSEQHYVSLCNKEHELVQPLASVRALLQLSENKKHHTLMAVPFGSTAALVRAIRRVLEKTKQVKRLLKKEDPFTVKDRKSRRQI